MPAILPPKQSHKLLLPAGFSETGEASTHKLLGCLGTLTLPCRLQVPTFDACKTAFYGEGNGVHKTSPVSSSSDSTATEGFPSLQCGRYGFKYRATTFSPAFTLAFYIHTSHSWHSAVPLPGGDPNVILSSGPVHARDLPAINCKLTTTYLFPRKERSFASRTHTKRKIWHDKAIPCQLTD